MNRIDRYIFREILAPTLIALLALTGILVGRQISALLELVLRWSPSPAELWELIRMLAPSALTFTIPTAVLVGVLTGLGRMSSDSESVALRAAGFSTAAIVRPVLALGVLAWAVNLALSIWIAPASVTRLQAWTADVATRQAALELHPRVFNEELEDWVLYVPDVSPDGRDWRGVLLANVQDPDETEIIVAESGRLTGDGTDGRYELTLTSGSTHGVSRLAQNRYTYSRFASHSIPLPRVPTVSGDVPGPEDTLRTPTAVLWDRIRERSATEAEEVEFHRRLAMPFAALAFALIAFPLGLRTRRGGRSMGLVISAVLMLAYYMLFIGGTRVAEDAQMSPFAGTWGANLVFALLGIVLLWRSGRENRSRFPDVLLDGGARLLSTLARAPRTASTPPGRAPRAHPTWFRILDVYVLRSFWTFFALVLVIFVSLFIVVTLFELLSDIVRNDTGPGVVASYFFFLLPQIFYWVCPLAVLVAVLISLGMLTKSNETLAVKAGAVSLYRMCVPLLVMGGLLSVGTYFLQDFLLPYTNRQQDFYRNTIKGRAEQSYRDPQRNWMAGSDDRIYYYVYFDPDENIFYDLMVFSFSPATFALEEWTYASRAVWDGRTWGFENGWKRSVGPAGEDAYEPFETREFPAMRDAPEHFKKEVRLASQMNYRELREYIDDLAMSGFNVSSLRVDLYRKLSFPLVTLIMAVIAVPFSFTTGRRGAFYGIGLSIVIGIGYWGAFEVFDKLGGLNRLSPIIAAWFPNLIFGSSGFWLLLKVRT